MSKRKTYHIKSASKSATYTKIPADKVSSFNSRASAVMKVANRDFRKKQKVSAKKASNIVLNA